MADNVRKFYKLALADPFAPPELQRRMFQVAAAAKDVAALEQLAQHQRLIEEIDAALGQMTTARVKVAWLRRPNRTVEELVAAIDGETRVSVLASVAEQTGLPTEAFERLGEVDSLKVAEKLIENTHTPPPVRAQAVVTWLRNWNQATQPYAYSVLTPHTHLFDLVVQHTNKGLLLREAAGNPLSVGSQRKVFEHCLTHAAFIVEQEQRSALAALAKLAVHPSTDLELRAEMLPRVASLVPHRDLATLHREVVAAMSGPLDPPEDTERLHFARTVTDEAAQLALAHEVAASKDQKLAAALARNPALCLAAVHPVFDLLVDHSTLKELVALHASRPALVDAILSHYRLTPTDELLEVTGRPEAALLAVVRAKAAAGNGSGFGLSYATYRSEYWTDETTMALPLAAFYGSGAPRSIWRFASAALCDAFGDDTAAWEMFETLADGGQPLGEVIPSVLLLLGRADTTEHPDLSCATGTELDNGSSDGSGQLALQV